MLCGRCGSSICTKKFILLPRRSKNFPVSIGLLIRWVTFCMKQGTLGNLWRDGQFKSGNKKLSTSTKKFLVNIQWDFMLRNKRFFVHGEHLFQCPFYVFFESNRFARRISYPGHIHSKNILFTICFLSGKVRQYSINI